MMVAVSTRRLTGQRAGRMFKTQPCSPPTSVMRNGLIMGTSATEDHIIDRTLEAMSDASRVARVRRWTLTPARRFLLYAAELIEHADAPDLMSGPPQGEQGPE